MRTLWLFAIELLRKICHNDNSVYARLTFVKRREQGTSLLGDKWHSDCHAKQQKNGSSTLKIEN